MKAWLAREKESLRLYKFQILGCAVKTSNGIFIRRNEMNIHGIYPFFTQNKNGHHRQEPRV